MTDAEGTTGRDKTPGAQAAADPAPSGWRSLRHPFAFGFFAALGALLAVALGTAFSNLSTVLIYVAFGLFAALGLDPIVRLLERRGLARGWGIVIVIVGLALVLGGVLMLIVPTVVRQVSQFILDVPRLIIEFERGSTYAWLNENFGDAIGDGLDQVQSFLLDPNNIASIGGGVLQVGFTVVSGISGAIIILVLSLYFLASLPATKQAFYRLAPAYGRPAVADLTERITDSIGGYLVGMVILASLNATFVFILYLVLDLPFPLLLAVVAFCITLIPLIGTVLFWVIGSTIALFADPLGALIFAAAYLVYMQVEAYVLTPRVMNRVISIPGALVVIGALVGGTLLGLLGALIAIPVTASLLLILKQVIIPRQDAKLRPQPD